MIEYEIRFKTKNGKYETLIISAADSARAVITWRRQNPDSEMLWMKRKDDVPGSAMDRRLPIERD